MSRNEIIAFANTIGKVSHSINLIDKMFERKKEVKFLIIKRTWRLCFVYFYPTFVFLLFLLAADKINKGMNVRFEWLFNLNFIGHLVT